MQARNSPFLEKHLTTLFGHEISEERKKISQDTSLSTSGHDSSNNKNLSNTEIGDIKLYEETKENIRELLYRYPNGVLAATFVQEYKQIFGIRMPFEQLGFKKAMILIENLDEVVEIQRNEDVIKLFPKD